MAAWYNDPTLKQGFLDVLAQSGLIENMAEVRKFIRSPQQWDEWYKEWAKYNYPTPNDDSWEDFYEAIGGNDDDDSGDEDAGEDEEK
jgi:hypothetical protein